MGIIISVIFAVYKGIKMKRKLTESEQDVTEETKNSKVGIDLGDLVASIKRKLKEEDNEVTGKIRFV